MNGRSATRRRLPPGGRLHISQHSKIRASPFQSQQGHSRRRTSDAIKSISTILAAECTHVEKDCSRCFRDHASPISIRPTPADRDAMRRSRGDSRGARSQDRDLQQTAGDKIPQLNRQSSENDVSSPRGVQMILFPLMTVWMWSRIFTASLYQSSVPPQDGSER